MPSPPDPVNHLKNMKVSNNHANRVAKGTAPRGEGRRRDLYKVKEGYTQQIRKANTKAIHTVGGPLLSTDAGGRSISGTVAGHISSENDMGSRVGTHNVLKVGLEAGIVAIVVVIEGHVDGSRIVSGVDESGGVNSDGRGETTGSVEERLKGKLTTDVVRGGIGEDYVLESTGGDLEVVVGVSPLTKTIESGIGKDRGMFGIGGI